ncbi:hypothetical protein BMS3Abin03_02787 [bacterium BMS3Abin03]|nr:hypothetical protein BMS3Abin03_02787 [bacterium BMS3Abin03]
MVMECLIFICVMMLVSEILALRKIDPDMCQQGLILFMLIMKVVFGLFEPEELPNQ